LTEPVRDPGTQVLAGIDAGGTRTRLVLASGEGELLACVEGGCASFVELGRDAARAALEGLWREAWGALGRQPRAADALFMGTGSVLVEADALVNEELLLELGAGQEGALRVDNDAWNAHAGGLLGRPGILLIAGTGSACLGRDDRGESWRAGGWGHLLDDRGSAFALGSAAMVAATRAADGRDEPTALTAVVRERLGLSDLREIFRRVHHDGLSRAEVAALAPQVVQHAEAGDGVAARLVEQGAQGLVEMVVTVARRLSMTAPELASTGGLIERAEGYRRVFLDQLERELPGTTLAQEGLPPVLGAVLLAAWLASGGPPRAAFVERLRASAAREGLVS
jgi:N-acetylglucosamine kinase-like BadF-type ATPase